MSRLIVMTENNEDKNDDNTEEWLQHLREGIMEWSLRSRKGEVCGMVDCMGRPTSQCPTCKNHYCYDHVMVHMHLVDSLESKRGLK